MTGLIGRYFGVDKAESTLGREVLGGLTTFATMSYIIFVQPAVLAIAGMDLGAVLVATCLSSAMACFYMGFIAGYPFALAPGMGQNFLFVFTICLGMGFSPPAGLAIVLCSGLVFLVLCLFKTREQVLEILPDCLRHAIGPGIGLFIAFVGLQWGGLVVSNPATMVTLGDFGNAIPLTVLLGLVVMLSLTIRGIQGAILLGIGVTGLSGWLLGAYPSTPQAPVLSLATTFQLDFFELFARWDDALVAILLLFFLDLFDTVGTLIAVSGPAGFLDKAGRLPGAGRAFLADALATCTGALLGTSTVTTYVESTTGVAAGARTGLAAVVTGICFLAAPLLAPLIAFAGQDLGPAYYQSLGIENSLVRMYPIVAPALIVVGFMMLPSLGKVAWRDPSEGFPAFLTVAMMPFGFGITEGISAGCVSYVVLKVLTGRWRDVHPALALIACFLIFRYGLIRFY